MHTKHGVQNLVGHKKETDIDEKNMKKDIIYHKNKFFFLFFIFLYIGIFL